MTDATAVQKQVMWNRLLAIVEEQAQTLVRTAFSTAAREAGDISAGIFDAQGRMIGQAVTGTPGHVNSMALSVGHFLEAYPPETMRDGDIFICNDPWKGTGHLPDITVVTPVFLSGRLVALFACTTHVVDIGGIGPSPDGKQVYHEGFWIPIMPLAREGVFDETLMKLLKQNVREPIQIEGDIYALAACNDTGGRRLREMMRENSLETLEKLSEFIIGNTETAMRAAIADLPEGIYKNTMTIDGFEEPIDLVATLSVKDSEIVVDYEGTSPASDFGINCALCYTIAYTVFGVKCVVAPSIPNNAGSLGAVVVRAPQGSIVNAQPPSAVMSRATIGHMLPDVVFGCLHKMKKSIVPAEGASSLWSVRLGAGRGMTSRAKKDAAEQSTFMVTTFHCGGAGARPQLDGLSATPFPSGVKNVPVEITESITPLVVWQKELIQDSGGCGKFRGGLGQRMVIGSREDAPFTLFASFDRIHYPPRGREGGKNGALGSVEFLNTGETRPGKGSQEVPAGEKLVLSMPGGGGYGRPEERDPEAVRRDVRAGYVSTEQAVSGYGMS